MNKVCIYYRDIGDYLTREEKLAIIHRLGNVDNPDMDWQILTPNGHNDWINHRNDKFGEFIPLAPEKKFDAKAESFFTNYSLGIATNKDAWLYNFSVKNLEDNLNTMVSFYNEQREEFALQTKIKNAKDFVDYNAEKISWTDMFLKDLENNKKYVLEKDKFCSALYRPFSKQRFCYEKQFLQRTYQQTTIYPLPDMENLVICLEGLGSNRPFGCLITNKIPDLGFAGIHTQCFPLYWYEETKREKTLFDSVAEPENSYYARRDAISNFVLGRAREQYGGKTTKEDIFYYVYGLLHNPDYRTTFAADLKKMLPRLPLIDSSSDFWKYVKAGRELAALHLHYEDYAHEAGVKVEINNAVYENYEVTKMRFPSKDDKSRIIYNPYITLTNIPAEAYEYVVNGKPAIEWIMERYQITTHKESGIVNNPNDWAREQGKPEYILDLLLSVIAVSVKTVGIVKGLPDVDFNNVEN